MMAVSVNGQNQKSRSDLLSEIETLYILLRKKRKYVDMLCVQKDGWLCFFVVKITFTFSLYEMLV